MQKKIKSKTANIVIVSSIALIEPVIKNRLSPLFACFIKEGFRVSFVCPKHKRNKDLVVAGVRLHEVDVSSNKPSGFVNRARQEVYDCSQILKSARMIEGDIWLLTIPSMFLSVLAPFFLKNKYLALDVRDLTWEYLSDKKLVQRISKKIFRWFFQRSLKHYQLLSAANESQVNYLKEFSQKKHELILVSNGISKDQFNVLSQLIEKKHKNALTVSYIGNVGLAQNLGTLVEAAESLPNINFKIIGTGIELEEIKQTIRNMGLNNIHTTGRIPWEELLEHYKETDILYAQLAPDYSGAVPSKLYEYLATGKHVIYGGAGQAAETLSEFDNYQLIPPCDASALVSAIKNYERKSEVITLSRKNQNKVFEKYIRENSVKGLAERIGRLL